VFSGIVALAATAAALLVPQRVEHQAPEPVTVSG